MRFTISSGELQKHLQVISKVINSKNSLPILDYYLFKLEENRLEILASDLENTMTTWLNVTGEVEGGIIAIEAKRLNDMIKEFPELPLSFEINPETYNVTVTSINGSYNIMSMDGQDFPVKPVPESEEAIASQIPEEVLLSGIGKTIFAVGNDELRPVMNGILIVFSEENVTFVASDSHKLVRYIRTDATGHTPSSFILPQKPAGILKNSLKGMGRLVEITFDNRNAFFQTDSFQLICRRIEGAYPAYNSVIPLNNPNEMYINRSEFLNTLKRVSVFSNQASYLIKLKLTSSQLEVSGQDIDYSISAIETIPCQYRGNEMEIGFKSTFLIEILQNIAGTDIRMELSDPSRAGLVLQADKENSQEDILMLLMPMMINT